MVHTQEGSVLHFCTKFEAYCSILSKIIKGSQKNSKFVHVVHNRADPPCVRPRPRALMGRLWSIRRRGPSSISLPNMKRIAFFVQKLFEESQNFEIGSCDRCHAYLGVVSWSARRRESVLDLCTKNWSGLFNSFKSYYKGVLKFSN